MLDLGAGQTVAQQVAAHDQPIRCVRFFDAPQTNAPMLVTGSWDKTVKYWDLRQSQAVATLQCQERVYTLDVKGSLLVIGTADRYIDVVNLNEPTKFYKTLQSPLKWQTRVVSCFKDATGFAVGSIEGRCAFQYVEDKDARLAVISTFTSSALTSIVSTSLSNVTGTLHKITSQTSIPSTPYRFTPSTAPSARRARMVHSTFGIRTPSIDLRVILLLAALFQQRVSTEMEISLHTLSATTGARDIWRTRRSIQIRLCCTRSWVMNANLGPL